MKTKQLTQLLFVISVFSLQAEKRVLTWQNGPIIIDGYVSDWTGNLRNFNQSTGLKYEFRNDSENLYIAYEVPEQQTQMKALTTGILIEISTKAKTKVKASISLPIIDRRSMGRIEGRGIDFANIKNSYLLGNYPIDLIGFKFSTGLIFPKQDSDLISFGYSWSDSDILAYELKIPLKDLFDEDYKLSSITASKITIKTKLQALQTPSGSAQGGKGGGEGMRGGGGGGQGGMGGGGGQGRPQGGSGGMESLGGKQGMSAMSQEVSFVEKFTISPFQAK
jgi:uncharacterized membrane protein YgcG